VHGGTLARVTAPSAPFSDLYCGGAHPPGDPSRELPIVCNRGGTLVVVVKNSYLDDIEG